MWHEDLTSISTCVASYPHMCITSTVIAAGRFYCVSKPVSGMQGGIALLMSSLEDNCTYFRACTCTPDIVLTLLCLGYSLTIPSQPETILPNTCSWQCTNTDGRQVSLKEVHFCLPHRSWFEKKEVKMSSSEADVVVIGAGLSGLTAGYTIRKEKPSSKVLVLEATGMDIPIKSLCSR